MCRDGSDALRDEVSERESRGAEDGANLVDAADGEFPIGPLWATKEYIAQVALAIPKNLQEKFQAETTVSRNRRVVRGIDPSC